MTTPGDVRRSAEISADGVYRYELTRQWGPTNGQSVTFVMLNPSTADSDVDDPTIRRCIGFAVRLGAAGLHVVNLYPYRATKPVDLARARSTVDITGGHEHDLHLAEAGRRPGLLVAAWGGRPAGFKALTHNHRVGQVRQLLGRSMFCLGATDDGSPRHPLYLKADAELIDWPLRTAAA